MHSAISCENLQFAIRDTVILKEINFQLEPGGYLSIIGPNGAGKSTLLKCLGRLYERGKISGKIFINGKDQSAFSQKELARFLAYVPQQANLAIPFTVLEFLNLSRYPAQLKNSFTSTDKDYVEKSITLTGIEHLVLKHMNELSGGERQLCLLAAALAQGTNIILLDEAAAFLDPPHASKLNQLLEKLNKEFGLTILHVTHDLSHPFEMGGKTLALAKGRQVFFGESSQMLNGGILEKLFEHPFSYIKHPVTNKTIVLAD